MDRFFVGAMLCLCLCLAPMRSIKPTAPERTERALFSVLYPRFVGWDAVQREEVEWYSVLLSFLRGVSV